MILNKKVALITGATGVIGSCLAEHFFRAGYKLVLTGRSKDKLNDLKKKLKEDVLIYPADISNYKEIKKILEFVEKEAGRLDTIIPAAGIYGEIGTLEQCDPEKWEDAFRVNVFGAMGVIKYALPLLKKSSSAGIILFAGGGEETGVVFDGAFCAAVAGGGAGFADARRRHRLRGLAVSRSALWSVSAPGGIVFDGSNAIIGWLPSPARQTRTLMPPSFPERPWTQASLRGPSLGGSASA